MSRILYRWADYRRRRVWVDGRPMHLTGRQAALLAVLAMNRGRPVARKTIIEFLWGDAEDGGPLTVTRDIGVHIYTLRPLLPRGAIVPAGPHGYGFRLLREDELVSARGPKLMHAREYPLAKPTVIPRPYRWAR